MLTRLASLLGLGVALGVAATAPANAGPFIFAGTDADDHGFASGGVNQNGWLFMQKAIENLGAGVTNGNKVVVSLGSDPGTQAGDAALSAFTLSSLVGSGYTFLSVNGAAAISTFFASGISSAAIIMLDSGGNVSGGLESSEETVITANATVLDNFLGAGGALFSQANSYGFLSALVPGLAATGFGDQGISLTAAGMAAFPMLTDADLSSGPYHNNFINTGAIPILGIGQNDGGLSIIIGAAGGSITNPEPPTDMPEPTTMTLLAAAALAGIAARRKRA